MVFGMNVLALVVAGIVGIVAGRRLFPMFFFDVDEFWESVKYTLIPDWVSLFRGEYFHDCHQSFKLSGYIILTVVAAGLSYYGVVELMLWLTSN